MERFIIPSKIQSLLYKGKRADVLWKISELIESIESGMFAEDGQEYVQFINAYRIRLLVQWNMFRDALAYISLECELFPKDLKNFAYRYFLLQVINERKTYQVKDQKTTQSIPWSGVAGMHELKAIFERDIIFLFTKKEIYSKFKIPLPNGFLLYGPPGCGKTFIARKLADEIKFNFIEIKPGDLGSTYVHGTQIEIKNLFENAIKNAPTLLFFDEIEAMVPSRQNNDVSFHYKAEVNEFLTQLDQCGKKNVLVVGATNFIQNIDQAILRPGRFDKKIFVGPPDLEARIEAFKIQLEERPHDKIHWEFLAEMSEFFTFADIENVVNEAGRRAIMQKTVINTNILGAVINSFHPKLNEKNIDEYFRF